MLNALREMKRFKFAPELDKLKKKLAEAVELKNEEQVRAAIKSVDFFLADQGQKIKNRVLELLPKEKEGKNGSTK